MLDNLLVRYGQFQGGFYAVVGFVVGIFLIGLGLKSIYQKSVNEDKEENVKASSIATMIILGIGIIVATQLHFYFIRKNPTMARYEALF